MRKNCSRGPQQKGKKSSSKQRTRCGKQRREVFRQFSPDRKNKKDTEVHGRTTILKSKKYFFTIDLLWRDMIFQPQKRNEWDTLKIGFSLWMLKGNKHLDNYAQITKKQIENVKIRINNFKDLKNMTTLLIGWRWYKEQQGDLPHTSCSSSTSWQVSTWQWKSQWLHSSQYDEQWMRDLFCQCMLNSRVSDCRNAVPTIRREVYTEYTPTACMTYTQSVHKHARMWMRACGSGQDGWLVSSLCAWKNPSSGQPCHNHVGRSRTFPLPVHHSTRHCLDRATFSKTTLYTDNHFRENLFQNNFLMNLLPANAIQSGNNAKESLSDPE